MLGVHLIDTTNFLFGTPIKVSGVVKNLYADTSAEDMSLIRVNYENGVVANITNLYNSVSTEFINIYGTEGALRFSRWPEEGLWFQPKDLDCDFVSFESLEYAKINTAKAIFEDFIQAILNDDTPTQTNGHKALETVKVMEAALDSHRRDSTVSLINSEE